jgi:hypothetical protein
VNQEVPELAFAEQMIELGRCLIDYEQNQYPKLDRDEAMPVEGRNHVRQEGAMARWRPAFPLRNEIQVKQR